MLYILFTSFCKIVYCSDCLLRPSPRYTANTTRGKVVFSVRCVRLSVHQVFLPSGPGPGTSVHGPGCPYTDLYLSLGLFKLVQLGPQLDSPDMFIREHVRSESGRLATYLNTLFTFMFTVFSSFW